jgi:hypothetical protein
MPPQQFIKWIGALVASLGVLTAIRATLAAPPGQSASPTPVAPYDACPGAPKSRLVVGGVAIVNTIPPISSRLRQEPGLSAPILKRIGPGERLSVIDGPACVDGYVWWKVQWANVFTGWTAEADPTGYWLVTAPPPTATPRATRTPSHTPNLTATRQARRTAQRATQVAALSQTAQVKLSATAARATQYVTRTAAARATGTQAAELKIKATGTAQAQRALRTSVAGTATAFAIVSADYRPVLWSTLNDADAPFGRVRLRGYVAILSGNTVVLYTSAPNRLVQVEFGPGVSTTHLAPSDTVAITVYGAHVGNVYVPGLGDVPRLIDAFWSK